MDKWPLINELATELRVGRNRRYQWKSRQSIPLAWQLKILALARRRRKRLPAKALQGPVP